MAAMYNLDSPTYWQEILGDKGEYWLQAMNDKRDNLKKMQSTGGHDEVHYWQESFIWKDCINYMDNEEEQKSGHDFQRI
eukprot:14814310-Ditylum_brightwellii.AAC.1